MKTTDQKINSLRNGGSVTIGRSNGIEVVVEKSGNGRTLRFVRISKSGFEVFKTICL